MKEKYKKDLREIKEIMTKSTRFDSLSGLSGVSTGVIALVGAFLSQQLIFKNQYYLGYDVAAIKGEDLINLVLIASGTLLSALAAAIFFTYRKTKNQREHHWKRQSKQLLINLLIPLATGGILCLMLLQLRLIGFLAPLSLIFYGLALINASKYTLPEIRTLGFIEIILGLAAFYYIEFGLEFWMVGFGGMQILFGLIVLRKY